MEKKKKRGKMGRIGEAARFLSVAAALAAGASAAEKNAFGDGGEAKTAAVASSLPNPGDDWILRKKREPRVETPENVGANGALRSENGGAAEFAALANVAAVGKIVAIGATGIETEDRRRDRRERTAKRPGDAILFLPPVDPSAAAAFCVEIWEASGAPDRDRFWLRNGDEFDGELLRVDRRRVWVRAFEVEFAVPRGRVRAVRFAEVGENVENAENREVGEAGKEAENGENGKS